MIKLYDIQDWHNKPVPLYVTDDGSFVLESDLLHIYIIPSDKRRYIRPILHALASLVNEDDTGEQMSYNGSHLPKETKNKHAHHKQVQGLLRLPARQVGRR